MSEKTTPREGGLTLSARGLLGLLRGLLVHNLALKIFCVLLAIILWMIVVTRTDAPRTRTVLDVPVQVTGQEALSGRGLAVRQDIAELVERVDVDVSVAQSERGRLDSPGAVTATIDLSTVTGTGRQQLDIHLHTEAGQARRANPAYVTVDIEPLDSRSIAVRVKSEGLLPEGYRLIGELSASPGFITVSGAESDVERIRLAQVEIDLSAIDESFAFSQRIRFLDADNQEVIAENLTVEATSVVVSGTVHPRQARQIQAELATGVVGTPAEGYVVRSIEVLQSKELHIAAPQDVLSAIEFLHFEPVSVQDQSESFTASAVLRRPEGVAWMEAEQVSVLVTIAEEEETRTFADIDIEIRNQKAGTEILYDEGVTATVEIRAARSVVRALAREDIVAYLDLAAYGMGDHQIPLGIELPGPYSFTSTPSPGAMPVSIRPLGSR